MRSEEEPSFFGLECAESSYIGLLLIGGDGPIESFIPMIDRLRLFDIPTALSLSKRILLLPIEHHKLLYTEDTVPS